MLPEIHKGNKPGRPIVNEIGSITEKISAFIDEHIRPLVAKIPSYVKDTSNFLSLTMGKGLHGEDLLVTIDVASLYTNIPHNEGFDTINKSLEGAQVNPF